MSRKILYAALTGFVFTLSAAAEEPAFTQIDYPGATATSAFGVNAHKDVVGFYVDRMGKTHGFMLSSGEYSTIDYPDASITQARGINNEGDIVGTYQVNLLAPGGGYHGFLLHRGVFTNVDFPKHLNTIAQRITGDGQIVGCYHDFDTMGSMHGMVMDDGEYRALDGSYHGLSVPASMNNGAAPETTVITGFYTDMMGKTHGYLVRRGSFAPFDFPGSLSTQAWDMNGSGEVVGVHSDSTGKVHGFLLSHRERDSDDPGRRSADIGDADRENHGDFDSSERDLVSIDYPGALVTRAFGINSRGDVAGHYADAAGKLHAFLRTRARRNED